MVSGAIVMLLVGALTVKSAGFAVADRRDRLTVASARRYAGLNAAQAVPMMDRVANTPGVRTRCHDDAADGACNRWDHDRVDARPPASRSSG